MSSKRLSRRIIFCLMVLTGAVTSWGAPALPNIDTNNVFNVTNAPYSAVGDGATDNTAALQSAINAAGAAGSGGTVLISGTGLTFMTGPLTLKSKVNVMVDAGTTLRMLPMNLWTNYPPQPGNKQTNGNLFYASGLSDLMISGSGTIDGQGGAWWSFSNLNIRAYMIYFNGGCHRVLVEDVTLTNSPAQNVVFKGSGGDITIQGITELEPASTGVASPSHNTDGLDLVGTNILAQNCVISVGDDNFALGSSGGATAGVLITNCTMGTGHGLSIGSSLTANIVSNVTVINCTYNGTDNGIRFKSVRGSGGNVHDFNFYNLTMNNVQIPLTIYSYYNQNVSSVSPATAASDSAQTISTSTPVWQNIVLSNVTATTSGSFPAGILWGLPEVCVSNVTLQNVQITAAKSFDLYNVRGFKFIDSQVTVPGSQKTFIVYNAQANFTNSTPGTAAEIRFDGLVTNGIGNNLAFYNAPASLSKSNILASTALTLSGSRLFVTNNLDTSLAPAPNFFLGTNAATMKVINNLALGGIINTSAGDGFTNGTYTLFTYGIGLTWGSPTLGTTPPGYLYALDTNTAGQVNLVVTQPIAPVITNSAASQTVVVGSNVTFNVVAGGTPTLSYQWWLNPTPTMVPDATNATLTLTNVQLSDAGDYFVIVTNNYGSATSLVATLTVLTPFQQWQITYFGSTNNPNAAPEVDADNDGMGNDAEFQAGTIPTNSASVLKLTGVAVQQGTNLVLTWSTAGPRTNLIQSAGGLTNGAFSDLSGPLVIPQTGDVVTNITLTGGMTNAIQFYRVRLGP